VIYAHELLRHEYAETNRCNGKRFYDEVDLPDTCFKHFKYFEVLAYRAVRYNVDVAFHEWKASLPQSKNGFITKKVAQAANLAFTKSEILQLVKSGWTNIRVYDYKS